MALVTGSMVRSGKCSNFGNCSLADARKTVEVPAGQDFVCIECGKPLLLMDTASAGGSGKTLMIGGLLLVALLAAGGVAWSLFAGKNTAAPTVAVPQIIVPPPVARNEAKNQARPESQPRPPLTGNCSDADAKAGLCRTRP